MLKARSIKGTRAVQLELEICRRDIFHWFDNWVMTYNPKLANERFANGVRKPSHLPFDLYARQREFITWLQARIDHREDGLVEKSRDIGFTWMAGGFAIHKWMWEDGFKTTFGSRGAMLVDMIGNMDSIFEKIRMLLRGLPAWMLPVGFDSTRHMSHMKIINPANGNTITGEAGDEMGRGGRSSLYIIDEAAFVERAERVDAATSANADVRIWGSTVNGAGNLFYRKRHDGSMEPRQIFRFHYTDDPRKTPEWAAAKKKSLEAHTWASEYDIDYNAAVEGICIPGKWVEAAKQIGPMLRERGIKFEPAMAGRGGLDVGAGKAKSVFVARFGTHVTVPESWGNPDTTETAFAALTAAKETRPVREDGKICKVTTLQFDEVGVGKGVLSTLTKHSQDPAHAVPGLAVIPINVGVPPTDTEWPDGISAEDKFANLKAELWWTMRAAFKATYEKVLFLLGEEGGEDHPLDKLISLPPDSAGPEATQLASQLSVLKWTKTETGKIMMETKKALATRGIPSPDHADALALTFDTDNTVEELLRAYGGR